MAQRGERLDSWKQIATYLRRGARTLQRWERDEGLPVHRLQHGTLGSVYAYTAELDRWWAERTLERSPELAAEPSVAVLPFADMSRARDQAYFCEGIAEEITNALGRVEGLRIAVQLSDGQTGFQFWARQYDRETRDVFAVQDEIARAVVGALRPALAAPPSAPAGRR